MKERWSDIIKPNNNYRYDHIIILTPLGEFSIAWNSWKDEQSYTLYLDGKFLDVFYSIENAKIYFEIYIKDLINNLNNFIKNRYEK